MWLVWKIRSFKKLENACMLKLVETNKMNSKPWMQKQTLVREIKYDFKKHKCKISNNVSEKQYYAFGQKNIKKE